MAKISLSKGGYTPISKGDHVFKIMTSVYDQEFGKLEVEMVTESGQKNTERFYLLRENGEVNEKVQMRLSFFMKAAVNDFDSEEIDTDDIVDCFIIGAVVPTEKQSTKDPSKTYTNYDISNFRPALGFENAKTEKTVTPKTEKTVTTKGDIDLDKLLG